MKLTACAAVLGGLAFAAPAWAHHSYAMFDRAKDVAVSGTVTDWKWTNPHTFMFITAPSATGPSVHWALEGLSPQVLRLKGWNREMVKVGDKVTVHVFPLKDGSQGGQIFSVVAADGHVYK